VQLIERHQTKRARDLIDEHYRAILRGFRIGESQRATVPLEQLLAVPAHCDTAEENVVRGDAVQASGVPQNKSKWSNILQA